ncbi:MAG TPA: hypothetical protein VL326_33810 [Kofleriaceae bacterium]|jgi:hypothetical protein|nr:hypothetical protein [Kofleriaceae bacterium]
MAETQEREFMGGGRSKMWTYLILMALLVGIVLMINLVWKNPDAARNGVKHFLGLPAWALATVAFVVGAIIFWFGLKIETDWPEAIGAFVISGSVAAFEIIVGWNTFAFGGIVVIPYLIPLVVFVLLLMYALRKSV